MDGEPNFGDFSKGGPEITVAEVCRKHGIRSLTHCQWQSKYADMSLPELKRVKELEAENANLKRIFLRSWRW
jgi:putative transposase